MGVAGRFEGTAILLARSIARIELTNFLKLAELLVDFYVSSPVNQNDRTIGPFEN